MIDLTGTSNLEIITKTLEDMDSLNIELFNESFKKSESTASTVKDSHMQMNGETKKKVIFKDSIKDNFLFDLPSDEETSTKEERLFSSDSKSNMAEDLFKIKTPIIPTTSIKLNNELESKFNFEQEDNQLFSQRQNSYSVSKDIFSTLQNELTTEKKTEQLKKIAKRDEDILTNLIDKSDTIDNKSRRLSLKDNISGNKLHSSIVLDSVNPKYIRKMESDTMVQSMSTLPDTRSQSISKSTKISTKESQSGKRNIELINDPLGLLSTSLLPEQSLQLMINENVQSKDLKLQSTKTEENLPEWLGGSTKLEDRKSEKKLKETDEISTSKQNIETSINSATDLKISDASDSKAASVHSKHLSMLFGTQFNQQTALINMQQPEHDLKTATVISQQNKELNNVSNAQYTILHNQEEQFNTLLKLQFERQASLEKQIKMQQERIDQYIQVLMTQLISTSSTTSVYASCTSESNRREKEFTNEIKEMEKIIKKLQVEKSKLEVLLSTVNERHKDEITFQTEFYQRQISFVKEAMMKSEERTRQEIECLETDYMTKLEKLKDEKEQIENQYKEEIHNLKNDHAQQIKELSDLHSVNIKLLQKEYFNIIESISKAKQIEDQMIETMTNRKTDIEDILQKANSIIGTILENKEKLEIKHNQIIEFRENTLKILEDHIKAQKLELKNQNDILQEYLNKFIETTEQFSTRIVQFITELQKQNMLSTQLQEMFNKKSASLLHERELFGERVKWEENYLQTLKETWVKEQEKQLQLLAQEKEIVATKRAQLEVLSKLKSSNHKFAKIELEAAIKTAQEATIYANKEKLKWQKKINEFNIGKQFLQDKENQLILRAKELQNLTQLVLTKKNEGLKALEEARYLENQNKEKFNQLQIQFEELMEREKETATEKYNVAKDRLVSLAFEQGKSERDTDALYYFQNEVLSFSDVQSQFQITSEIMNIDPNLTMLTLNINDEIDSINNYTQMFDD
ncbi:fas-binding factor 1 twitchy isoform X1 [Osmia lignaria lignaria]|uniref:fas-binding factor 1 twitchy isoform X1 n=2 Tax=Osmia lignaria lignaria TaxID=1437193 RepID=UPI00402B6D08